MNWMRWNSRADRLGQALDDHRLGQARHALDEHVAPGQQRDDQPLEQPVLADQELLDLVDDVLHRGRAGELMQPCVQVLSLVWPGAPAPPAAVEMGTAKPIPMKKPCWEGLASAVTMPTTCPLRLSSGPPELPGLTAASNWMRPLQRRAALDVEIERFSPEMTPALSEPDSAERVADGVGGVADLDAAAPSVAGTSVAGESAGCRTAMSFSGCSWRHVGGGGGPVGVA